MSLTDQTIQLEASDFAIVSKPLKLKKNKLILW